MALIVFGQVKGSVMGRGGMLEEVYWYEEGVEPLPSFIAISYVKASGRELDILCDLLRGIPLPSRRHQAHFPFFVWRSAESCFAIVDAIHAMYPPPDPEPRAVYHEEDGGDESDEDEDGEGGDDIDGDKDIPALPKGDGT